MVMKHIKIRCINGVEARKRLLLLMILKVYYLCFSQKIIANFVEIERRNLN